MALFLAVRVDVCEHDEMAQSRRFRVTAWLLVVVSVVLFVLAIVNASVAFSTGEQVFPALLIGLLGVQILALSLLIARQRQDRSGS